jgi:hypothetical protein
VLQHLGPCQLPCLTPCRLACWPFQSGLMATHPAPKPTACALAAAAAAARRATTPPSSRCRP